MNNYEIPEIDVLKIPYHGGEEEQTAKLLEHLKEIGVAIITDGDWKYLLPDNKALIMGYTGSQASVMIPSTVGGNKVSMLADSAFYNKTFTDVTIPDNVNEIGSAAFQYCSGLKTANIPKGIDNIPESLFERCSSLESIEIPGNINSIGKQAFFRCTSEVLRDHLGLHLVQGMSSDMKYVPALGTNTVIITI